MSKSKCMLTNFNRTTDGQLDSKATAVQTGLAENTSTFPTPPVSPLALGSLINQYNTSYSAYKRGGLDQKPAFDSAKAALKNALTLNARYVDGIAAGNETLIVAAGYVPTKTTDTTKPIPAKPAKVKITRGQGIGELQVESAVVKYSSFYGLIVTQGRPLTNPHFVNGQLTIDTSTSIVLIDITKPRKKRLLNLKPGTMYYMYMWAGNSTGISSLSNVAEIMAA